MSLIIAVCAIFGGGAILAALIWMLGDSAKKQGRAEEKVDAEARRNKENIDVMQKQDELAAIAAKRPDPDDVAERLRRGDF